MHFTTLKGQPETNRDIHHRYRGYIRSITDTGEVGQLNFSDDEPLDYKREQFRLRSAAKAEGIHLSTKKDGRSVMFWISQRAVEAK